MNFTAEKPTVEGWYWFHIPVSVMPTFEGIAVRPVRKLQAYGRRLCIYIPVEGWTPLEHVPDACLYAGPLTPPALPSKDHADAPAPAVADGASPAKAAPVESRVTGHGQGHHAPDAAAQVIYPPDSD